MRQLAGSLVLTPAKATYFFSLFPNSIDDTAASQKMLAKSSPPLTRVLVRLTTRVSATVSATVSSFVAGHTARDKKPSQR